MCLSQGSSSALVSGPQRVTLGDSHSGIHSQSHSGFHTRPQSALVSGPQSHTQGFTLRVRLRFTLGCSQPYRALLRVTLRESHSGIHTGESHSESHSESHLGIHTRPCSLCPFQDSWPVAAPQGVRGQALGLLLQIRERKEDGSALLTAGMGLRPTQVPHAHRSAGTCTVGFRGPRGFSAQ